MAQTEYRGLITDERGQDLIEYGLLAALISVALIAGVLAVGGSLEILWNDTSDEVVDAASRIS